MSALALLEAATSANPGTPKLAVDADYRLKGRMPAEVEISRKPSEDAGGIINDDGTVTIYGADLPLAANEDDGHSNATARGEVHEGDGTTTVFDTSIPYAAFSNNNWIVLVDGAIIEQGAGAGKFTVSDDSGDADITFGTAPADGAKIEIFKVTVDTLQAATTAGVLHDVGNITTRDVMWANLGGTNIGASNVYVRPQSH